MRRLKTIANGLALVLAVAPVLAQEFQIRAQVDLVVVPFTVKGENNELIAGMDAEDFTVLEDNVEQTIEQFSIEPIPLSAVVLIDTGVEEDSLTAIQEAIPSIVFGFGPLDEVAVYHYNNEVEQMLDFTDDRDVLRDALDELKLMRPGPQFVGGRPAQPGPVINGLPTINTARTPLRRDTRILHDAVYQAGFALRDRPEEEDFRRKIIVLVSDGNDTGSEGNLDDTALFLMDADIQVYSIGLETGLFGRLFNTLDDYSRLTGGDVYNVGTDSLELMFSQITEQARNQYVLTYISSNPPPEGRIVFRRIEVLTDQPYDIVHRLGYYQTP